METVTITKLWHKPEITINVDIEGISLSIPLDDFVSALIQEIGSVATVLTQKTFSDRVEAAKERVILGIQGESLKVRREIKQYYK